MIQIRDAILEDASVLSAAEKLITAKPGYLVSQPDEINVENFRKKIQFLNNLPNGKYVVAEKGNQIVGHAMLDPMGLKAIEHVVRLTIVIHPGYEGQGIGEKILSFLIEWAKAAPKVMKIELNVRSINKRAIRLYQKLGFNVEGRLRNRLCLNGDEYTDDLEMSLPVKTTLISPTVVSLAIGKVFSDRKEAIDDDWDSIKSYIELDPEQFSSESLLGLDCFSHVEIVFFMNQVDMRKIETSARHPRNNEEWPKVGIFAQRGKNRPNQIGTTICKILKIEGLRIYLEGLDAIDGTSVLDIKPWVKEFGPRGNIKQPAWISELMEGYWTKKY